MKTTVCTLALLGTLVACGGGTADTDAGATASAQRAVTALLDDEGGAMPSDPQVVPTGPGALTRARRYATAAQAQQLEAALGAQLVRVELGGAGVVGPAEALRVVWGAQVAHGLPDSVPVLLHASDPRWAAQVAEGLADAGLTRVWIVGS